MMDAMVEVTQMLMYPLVIIMIVMLVISKIMAHLRNKQKKKKKKIPRDEGERIKIGLERGAKSSNLLKYKTIYVTGDSAVPRHRVGVAVSGVMPCNKEIVVFFRKNRWKFWEQDLMLKMEPELVGDMNAGEIVIKGRGIEPINEDEFYVIPPSHHYQEVKPNEVATRRSRVQYLRFMRLLEMDINNDISRSVKESFRGGPEPALAELYRRGSPPTKTQEELERESERIEDRFKKQNSSYSPQMDMGGR